MQGYDPVNDVPFLDKRHLMPDFKLIRPLGFGYTQSLFVSVVLHLMSPRSLIVVTLVKTLKAHI
jgi:hypothetical protein